MRVLLLHAWPLDESMWGPQVAALDGAGYEAEAPRLYGRGSAIDDWAAQLLREFEGPLLAVGASMGGYCALALARRAPERVLGLVLAGARAEADTSERRRQRDELVSSLRTSGAPPDLDSPVPAEELAAAQEAMRGRLDLTGVARSFGGPLLVCVGDGDDLLSVEDARSLADLALQGRLEVFAGAGHLPSVEQPERFNAVLLEFLAQWR